MAFDLKWTDKAEEQQADLSAAMARAVEILELNPTVQNVLVTTPAKPDLLVTVQRA